MNCADELAICGMKNYKGSFFELKKVSFKKKIKNVLKINDSEHILSF